MMSASNAVRTASVTNWMTSCRLLAPRTLRSATSRARKEARGGEIGEIDARHQKHQGGNGGEAEHQSPAVGRFDAALGVGRQMHILNRDKLGLEHIARRSVHHGSQFGHKRR